MSFAADMSLPFPDIQANRKAGDYLQILLENRLRGKGDVLSKQGKYDEGIKAYDKATDGLKVVGWLAKVGKDSKGLPPSEEGARAKSWWQFWK